MWTVEASCVHSAVIRMLVCPILKFRLKFQCPTVMVFGSEAFGKWIGHEGGILMNEISALIPRASWLSFHHVRIQWQVGHLQTRKMILTLWSQTFSLQNCEKYISIAYKPPSPYGTLVEQPKLTKTGSEPAPVSASMDPVSCFFMVAGSSDFVA